MEQFDGDFQFAQEQDGVTDFRNDTFVPPTQLASGILVDLDGPVAQQSVLRKPVVRVRAHPALTVR